MDGAGDICRIGSSDDTLDGFKKVSPRNVQCMITLRGFVQTQSNRLSSDMKRHESKRPEK